MYCRIESFGNCVATEKAVDEVFSLCVPYKERKLNWMKNQCLQLEFPQPTSGTGSYSPVITKNIFRNPTSVIHLGGKVDHPRFDYPDIPDGCYQVWNYPHSCWLSATCETYIEMKDGKPLGLLEAYDPCDRRTWESCYFKQFSPADGQILFESKYSYSYSYSKSNYSYSMIYNWYSYYNSRLHGQVVLHLGCQDCNGVFLTRAENGYLVGEFFAETDLDRNKQLSFGEFATKSKQMDVGNFDEDPRGLINELSRVKSLCGYAETRLRHAEYPQIICRANSNGLRHGAQVTVYNLSSKVDQEYFREGRPIGELKSFPKSIFYFASNFDHLQQDTYTTRYDNVSNQYKLEEFYKNGEKCTYRVYVDMLYQFYTELEKVRNSINLTLVCMANVATFADWPTITDPYTRQNIFRNKFTFF